MKKEIVVWRSDGFDVIDGGVVDLIADGRYDVPHVCAKCAFIVNECGYHMEIANNAQQATIPVFTERQYRYFYNVLFLQDELEHYDAKLQKVSEMHSKLLCDGKANRMEEYDKITTNLYFLDGMVQHITQQIKQARRKLDVEFGHN